VLLLYASGAALPSTARWLLLNASGSAGALAGPAQVTRWASAFGLAPWASTPHPSSCQSATISRSPGCASNAETPRALRLAISTSLRTTGPTPAFALARVSGADGVRVAVFVPQGVVTQAAHWWLLLWPSGNAFPACQLCSDSSIGEASRVVCTAPAPLESDSQGRSLTESSAANRSCRRSHSTS